MVGDLRPSICWTTLIVAPDAMARLAAVWRSPRARRRGIGGWHLAALMTLRCAPGLDAADQGHRFGDGNASVKQTDPGQSGDPRLDVGVRDVDHLHGRPRREDVLAQDPGVALVRGRLEMRSRLRSRAVSTDQLSRFPCPRVDVAGKPGDSNRTGSSDFRNDSPTDAVIGSSLLRVSP
jgi:hypothetical protein